MPIVLKSESLDLLEPSGPVKACNGIALPLPLPLPYFILSSLVSTYLLPSYNYVTLQRTFRSASQTTSHILQRSVVNLWTLKTASCAVCSFTPYNLLFIQYHNLINKPVFPPDTNFARRLRKFVVLILTKFFPIFQKFLYTSW